MKVFLIYGENETEGPITDTDTLNRRMSALAKEHGTVRMERADVICDFCSWPRVSWTFSTGQKNTEMYAFIEGGQIEHHIDADGLWAACDECKDFIMAHDWDNLAERAVRHADALRTPMAGMPEALVRMGVKTAHKHFQDGWPGDEPVPLQDDDHFLASLGITELDFEPYRKGFND